MVEEGTVGQRVGRRGKGCVSQASEESRGGGWGWGGGGRVSRGSRAGSCPPRPLMKARYLGVMDGEGAAE
jgi:hypothetical protein